MFDALTPSSRGAFIARPAGVARTRCTGVVVVPACNEADRIGACLEALRPQAVAARCAVVVVCNGTRDETARIARGILDRPGLGRVVDLGAAPLAGGVGRARAKGFAVAQRRYRPDALLTTDADCVVAPDWLARNLQALREVDVVFGRVLPMTDGPEEAAPFLPRQGDIEDRYMRTAVRLAARLDPRPHDPDPAHCIPSGASLAFRPGILDTIGGFPPLPLSEDRAFASAAEYHDLRVRYCGKVSVHASCRLSGRAAGGMADTLRARCADADPLCDDWLEPAETFALRHEMRGRLRRAWPDRERLARLLAAEGVPRAMASTSRPDSFGAQWAELEASLPRLRRRRLRHSDARRELPRLLHLLARAEDAAATAESSVA